MIFYLKKNEIQLAESIMQASGVSCQYFFAAYPCIQSSDIFDERGHTENKS